MYYKKSARNRRLISALLLASAAESVLADTHPGDLILADNGQVLSAWQQSAGGAAQPELVKQEDGGTKIEWHGGVTLNKYVNTASGGALQTPQTSGSYYKAQIGSDLRVTSPDGNMSFAQVSLTNSNDRAVLSQYPTQINSLVIGRAGPGYQMSFGDTALNLSQLAGSLGGMRGFLGQKQFGLSTIVSGAAGVISPSWEALEGVVPRTQFLRNAYAAKVETKWGESTQLFVIQEGYSDNQSSLDSASSLLTPASASVTTMGFSYQKNSLSLTGETGASRWQETGQAGHSSMAYVFDARWTQQYYGLYGGHHDTGLYYTSLAGQAAPGLKETFVGGNWTAASWLGLNMDLRHSENKLAGSIPSGQSTINTTRTNAVATQENITFGQKLPGLSLALQQSVSNGENSGGSAHKTTAFGASTQYSGQSWNGGVGYNLNKVANPSAMGLSAKTATWTYSLGRNFMGGSSAVGPAWMASVNGSVNVQRYMPDAGSSTSSQNFNLQMHLQRDQWGMLDANYGEGYLTSPVGGAAVRTRIYGVSASHSFGQQNSIRFYLSNNGNIAGAPNQVYNTRQVGAELIYTF
jgi:hypothetical protein